MNHQHKDFLFIKPQRTASSSITITLLPYTKPNNSKGFYITGYHKNIKNHLTYSHYLNILGAEKLENAILFGTVRNPWDRWVSWWKYSLMNKKREKLTLKEFIQIRENHMHEFFIGADNIYYIRFENLQQDFDVVCDKIGIPHQQLPHENKSNHKHYTEYYNDETRKIIAQKYKQDIEYFGYKFGK